MKREEDERATQHQASKERSPANPVDKRRPSVSRRPLAAEAQGRPRVLDMKRRVSSTVSASLFLGGHHAASRLVPNGAACFIGQRGLPHRNASSLGSEHDAVLLASAWSRFGDGARERVREQGHHEVGYGRRERWRRRKYEHHERRRVQAGRARLRRILGMLQRDVRKQCVYCLQHGGSELH
jgi:hypothetical protein